jgi:hypothetical protein
MLRGSNMWEAATWWEAWFLPWESRANCSKTVSLLKVTFWREMPYQIWKTSLWSVLIQSIILLVPHKPGVATFTIGVGVRVFTSFHTTSFTFRLNCRIHCLKPRKLLATLVNTSYHFGNCSSLIASFLFKPALICLALPVKIGEISRFWGEMAFKAGKSTQQMRRHDEVTVFGMRWPWELILKWVMEINGKDDEKHPVLRAHRRLAQGI